MNYLTAEKKQEIFTDYGKSNSDTGSPESQIALFSYRINHLTEHLKTHRKDYGTQRALLKLVGKRRRLLDYLKDNDRLFMCGIFRLSVMILGLSVIIFFRVW